MARQLPRGEVAAGEAEARAVEAEEMYPSMPLEVPELTDLDDPERLERAAEDSDEVGGMLLAQHGQEPPESRHTAKASVGYVKLGTLRNSVAVSWD